MAQTRRMQKIRVKKPMDADLPFLGEEGLMTRDQAVERVCNVLENGLSYFEAQRLIGLFSITPEELAEAGISYEEIRALERLAMFF